MLRPSSSSTKRTNGTAVISRFSCAHRSAFQALFPRSIPAMSPACALPPMEPFCAAPPLCAWTAAEVNFANGTYELHLAPEEEAAADLHHTGVEPVPEQAEDQFANSKCDG
uniref:Uncharacterized protein n=1 Tax=Setaria viridis TaxID=4556 RepID=A0A4V6D3K3_SETVI|nr:uncharacterized protein LOC117862562 isoform X1 [Setaria viridis]TKW03016.1 hypothetical protein SEVIR_7G042320v2 [Setaria viridis]